MIEFPTTPAAAAVHYATVEQFQAWLGTIGAAVLSNAAGQTTLDADRLEAALSHADAEIDHALRARGYAAPLSPSSPDFAILSHVATRLAGYWLFAPRQQRDEGGDGPSADTIRSYAWRKDAVNDLNRVLLNGLASAERFTDAATYPVAVE